MTKVAADQVRNWSTLASDIAYNAKTYSRIKIADLFDRQVQSRWKSLQPFVTKFWELIEENGKEGIERLDLLKIRTVLEGEFNKLDSEAP